MKLSISNEIKPRSAQLLTVVLLGALISPLAGLGADLENRFATPPAEARPWTFYYWLKGASAEEGITADMEAMAEVGLGGAYLMPLIAPDEDPFFDPPVRILSERYWQLTQIGRAHV